MSTVALRNGEPIAPGELDAARLLGLSCYETMSVANGDVRALDQHLERLAGSLATLAMDVEGGTDALRGAIDQALAAWGGGPGVLRLTVAAHGVPMGLSMKSRSTDVYIQVSPPRYPDLSTGVAAITASRRAPSPESWPTHVKAPCLPRLLAYREAEARGAFEALLLDARGHIVSGARSNVFAVLEGVLVTPPAPPALPGITRSLVLEAAEAQVLRVREDRLHRDGLADADELFVTLTGPGVVPVTSLDGAPMGKGRPGATTQRLAKAVAWP